MYNMYLFGTAVLQRVSHARVREMRVEMSGLQLAEYHVFIVLGLRVVTVTKLYICIYLINFMMRVRETSKNVY